jgi:hypothetical protein
METALRYEIENNILELANKIYPTNAPEGSQGPYLVYARITTRKPKTLEGYTNKQALSYMFSIMTRRYEQMTPVRDKVEELLMSLPGREIGDKKKFYIEDIDINNIDEQYEHQLGVNRGIIDFTIYY